MKDPFSGARNSLNYLIIAQDVIAIIIKVVTMLYYRILATFLTPKDRSILYGHLFNLYLIGIQIMIVFASSLPLWRRLWNIPSSNDLCFIIRLWLWTGFVVIASSLGTLWAVSLCGDELEAATETAMLYGIDSYYIDPDWKLLWDELQYTKQCCGVNTYTDWMDTYWMSEIAHLNNKFISVRTYAPYACCRKEFKNCSEKYSPISQNIGRLRVSLINTKGCLPIFMKHFWRLIYIIFGLLLIALKLQCSIYGLIRFILNRQCDDSLPTSDDDYCIHLRNDMNCNDATDLEGLGVTEVCSCGKVLNRDIREGSPDYKSCFGREPSKIAFNCRNPEIIH